MNNKSVGIDARMWDHPGIGRYIRELSRGLASRPRGLNVSFLGNSGRIKEFFNTNEIPLGDTATIEAGSKIYSLAEQWEIPRKSSSLDLLHVPHFNVPVWLKKKLVVTVHDLIYLHEPDASRSRFGKAYVTWLLKIIARKAAAVLTVSEYTRQDLLGHFPALSRDRVFVTYEAASPVFQKIEDKTRLDAEKKQFNLSKPFVLFVGTLKPHKNLSTLVEALKVLRETKAVDHELVVAGRMDARHADLIKLVARHSFVRYLGQITDPDLAALYNLADVFVLPSFYEGFGLPAVEAMACGTPVIASNRSSLPEVIGSAGISFDPGRVDALADVLYNVLTDKELRKNMSNLGLEQAKLFSWNKTADQTCCVYEQVTR